MAGYELRAGDVKNKKQSMADLKLRRLNELNLRLREDLDRPRIRVSEASMRYVRKGMRKSKQTTPEFTLLILSSSLA